jgi:hypothetical protein
MNTGLSARFSFLPTHLPANIAAAMLLVCSAVSSVAGRPIPKA